MISARLLRLPLAGPTIETAQNESRELPGQLNNLMLPHERNSSELFFDMPSLFKCE
jgi:hypothetical protein